MLVSCITPITESRRHLVPVVDNIIRRQTYPHIEHIYVWCEGTIGHKRNIACEQAKGEVILHIDSDDLYADDWVEKQVRLLLSSGADICGLRNIHFVDRERKEAWQYRWSNETLWVAGATMCYHKSVWRRKQFRDIQVGEDYYFLDGASIVTGDYEDKFVATLHADNTAPHKKSTNWHKIQYEYVSIILKRIGGPYSL